MRWALLLTGAMVALLLLMRLPLRPDRRPEQFFGGEACAVMPCWQGIRPGVTTIAEAVRILKQHPWVDQVSDVNAGGAGSDAGLVYWSWSRRYPFAAHAEGSSQGIIIGRNHIVEQIYLTTDLPLGAFWLHFGQPTGGTVDFISDLQPLRIDNTTLFGRAGLSATARLYADCQTIYADIWHTPVYLWLQHQPTFPLDFSAYMAYVKQMRTGFHTVRGILCP